MKKNHKFYILENISLESSPISITISYLETDQGRPLNFQYKFIFSLSKLKNIQFKEGLNCRFDDKTSINNINFNEVPEIVLDDLKKWLKKELNSISIHHKLFDPFTRILKIIENKI